MRDWRSLIAERFAEAGLCDPATCAEVIDELAQHFEERERELRRSGAPDASVDARLDQELDELDPQVVLAIRVSQSRAAYPAAVEGTATLGGWLDGLARDIAVAWRSLRRTPGVTSVIVASLAVALGANTAIFSLTDAMYLRRLDVPNAKQLVRVDALRDGRSWSLPYSAFRTLRSAPGVPKLAAFRFEGVAATSKAGDEERFWLDLVTGEFFDLVGITPLVGRTITAGDEQSAAQIVVVSEDYWRRHLGGRADVLGQVLRMNDKLFTIVGVMPSRYHGLHFAHRFVAAAPFTVSVNGFANTPSLATTIVARLDVQRGREPQRAAITAAVQGCCAQGEAPYRGDERRATNLRVVFPDDPPYADSDRRADAAKGLSVQLTDASRGLRWGRDLRDRYKVAVIGMVAAVVLLLLIACANVATLLLVRGELRAREFAIRRSLGASAGRVRRQLFVEAVELCVVGAAVGVPFAWMITTLLARALPPSAHALGDEIAWRENGRVIALTLGITALCAVVTSLWPAWRAGREDLAATLSGTRARGGNGSIGQRVLAIGQISAAMVLITAAWLFVATTRNLTKTAGGYGSRDVFLGQVNARELPDSGATRIAAIETLRDELGRAPGVMGAAYSYNAPLIQDGLMQTRAELRGSAFDGLTTVRLNLVSPEFFTVSGAGILRGREFTRSDDLHADLVAVVSESFERRYYAGQSALGMQIDIPGAAEPRRVRVVGVARDARYDRMSSSSVDLRNPATEMMYLPVLQQTRSLPLVTMILRSAVDPSTTARVFRRAVESHAGMQVGRVTNVGAYLDDAASRERFSAALATSFGVLAVMLATIGVLSVLAFQVARRTKEIGVRMALGAQRGDTVLLVVRQTLGMLGVAIAMGAPCAAAAAWLIRAQLYGVTPWDPRAMLAAAAVMCVAGLVASAVPSYRAVCVDPLVALRED